MLLSSHAKAKAKVRGEEYMAKVDDVAAAILNRTGPISTWKLQKLVYYAQAWHLVWEDRPLFDDAIEAWANGPVVPTLYAKHRGQYTIATWPTGDPDGLDDGEGTTIDAVLGFYGEKTGQLLSMLTHQERPWLEAREGLAPGERGSAVITHDAMADYYGGLI
jgi:uncharacterized phage-associated protein